MPECFYQASYEGRLAGTQRSFEQHQIPCSKAGGKGRSETSRLGLAMATVTLHLMIVVRLRAPKGRLATS